MAVFNVALRFNDGEKLLDVSALTKGECIPDSVHSNWHLWDGGLC